VLPRRLAELSPAPLKPRRAVGIAVNAVAALIVLCSLVQMDQRFGGTPPTWAQAITGWVQPLNITSPYGLFSIMATPRCSFAPHRRSDRKDRIHSQRGAK
jgi:hypothetical protein